MNGRPQKERHSRALSTVRLALPLVFLLILVCAPRFNRADILLEGLTGGAGDAPEYVRMVNQFRGVPDAAPNAPFSYRPMVPLVASLLPFDALTAINVVNVAALATGLLLLLELLAGYGLGPRYRMAGGVMYVVSFPTFYYGAIGMVDSTLVACLVAGMYLIAKHKWLWLAALVVLGAAVKETIVLLLPVAWIAMEPCAGRILRRPLVMAGLISALGLTVAALRLTAGDQPQYQWGFDRLAFNLARPRAWISAALAFGVPGSLVAWLLPRYLADRERRALTFSARAPLVMGFALSIALYGFAMLSAHADGRFIWTGYAFSIPLALLLVRDRLELSMADSSSSRPAGES